MRLFLIGLALLAMIGPTGADARRRRQRTEQSSGEFAYYMLSLSWARGILPRTGVSRRDLRYVLDRGCLRCLEARV